MGQLVPTGDCPQPTRAERREATSIATSGGLWWESRISKGRAVAMHKIIPSKNGKRHKNCRTLRAIRAIRTKRNTRGRF